MSLFSLTLSIFRNYEFLSPIIPPCPHQSNAWTGFAGRLSTATRMRARIADLGSVAFPSSTADLAKLIAADTEKWVKVIRTANIKL
jgi:hypothetical protein